ncbi:hypothetical protein QBC39DRAFT_346370 [Podospora conica]|nr:hypothetical protein QBC39DRAFT_346370 [Schizothecium conicum]
MGTERGVTMFLFLGTVFLSENVLAYMLRVDLHRFFSVPLPRGKLREGCLRCEYTQGGSLYFEYLYAGRKQDRVDRHSPGMELSKVPR